MKKIISIILVAALLLALLTSCGSQSTKIVGEWTPKDSGRFSRIEFFSDGTYTSSHPNYEGHYSIDGNRIRLAGILVSDITCDFEVKGNTLILNDDEYKRVK